MMKKYQGRLKYCSYINCTMFIGIIVPHFTYDSNKQLDIRTIERCPKLLLASRELYSIRIFLC